MNITVEKSYYVGHLQILNKFQLVNLLLIGLQFIFYFIFFFFGEMGIGLEKN